jgi:PAS domain S-box-containing protein
MWLLLWCSLGAPLLQAAPRDRYHPEYLISNWSAGEGIPENSALVAAQTPDGYIWIGSTAGLLRFNGQEFTRASRSGGLKQLDTTVHHLAVDSKGRLWASTTTGLAVMEKGLWRLTATNVIARTIAESPDGSILAGSPEGQLFQVDRGTAIKMTNVPPLAPSGVFLVPDKASGKLWLANRFFIGTWNEKGWDAVGPQHAPRGSLLAGAARAGGIWILFEGQLWHYQSDGQTQRWKAPSIDSPRELFEDATGNLWVTSAVQGLVRWRPGGLPTWLNATNGLNHSTARSVMQDEEGNIWIGTSSSGLYRLKPRYFKNAAVADGLTDHIVKTVAEERSGQMVFGTQGGGMGRLVDDHVAWALPPTKQVGRFAWSVLCDRNGRVWTGTYSQGLFVEENGVERPFRLPRRLGPSVAALLEDSAGRIWVGASLGLGVIENGSVSLWDGGAEFTNINVRSIVEDRRTSALWLGTYGHGVWKLDRGHPGTATHIEGLPRKRITALSMDEDGCVWAGIFGEGLFCIRGNRITPVGRQQGLPAGTIGSILEDGRGCFWLGSDQGIIRVTREALHAVASGKAPAAPFSLFNTSDGMAVQECSEGHQPCATRDSQGRLWFGTLHGLVHVDPAELQLNQRPPPVQIEQFSYLDRQGTNHVIASVQNREIRVPAGSTGFQIRYAALTYTAPDKVRYAYHLEGVPGSAVEAENRRIAEIQSLPPGTYRFVVRAANNDGVWSRRDAAVAFVVEPFVWQTLWFRTLAMMALLGGIAMAGWKAARDRYRGQIERLEQQRALAHEKARLAAVMEATTDLVAFADREGVLLHLNPAGTRLLHLQDRIPDSFKIDCLFAPESARHFRSEALPAAETAGTWQGESMLMRADGVEIPVSQVVIAHRNSSGQVTFISTIARDISDQKHAAKEKERLQARLMQAQKLESVGRLAGGVAHDFNNMLQVILGNVEMAIAQVQTGTPVHRDLLEIRRSAQRSADLTRQLLGFARKQAANPRVLDLNETVDGMLRMLRRLLGENVQLSWLPGARLWPVRIDPVQVDQILANLATNARDALSGGGVVVVETENLTVTSGSKTLPEDCPPGDYVVLTVSDNGKGIPTEIRDHLFEPFFTTKALGEGTGLGLATVFGIVKQNAGAITVESHPGQGATFKVFLPRATAVEQPVDLAGLPLPGGNETILLVEDELQILEVGRRTLESQGYRVLSACQPGEAIALARSHQGRVDLLITDIVMPQMNGKELREEVARIQPGIKCLYMSGYPDDIIARNSGLGPGEAFIQKPFGLQDFTDKVRVVLGGSHDPMSKS